MSGKISIYSPIRIPLCLEIDVHTLLPPALGESAHTPQESVKDDLPRVGHGDSNTRLQRFVLAKVENLVMTLEQAMHYAE